MGTGIGDAVRPDRPAPQLGDGILHPVVLASLAVLVLNDHVLKARWPGWWTGKLSDVAGLVFFPVLLVAVVELGLRIAGRTTPWRHLPLVAVVATGVGFALTNVTAVGGDLYVSVLSGAQHLLRSAAAALTGGAAPTYEEVVLARDATDLLALAVLVLPYRLMRRRAARFVPRPQESATATAAEVR